MAKKKVRGVCRLCRKWKSLCKSHYLGAAIHRLGRQDGKDAVMMTPKLILETQRHLWAHLLCSDCEQRLNKFGETPVLRLLDTGRWFSLLQRMLLVPTPVKVKDDVVTFSGEALGIDTDALAHFALGLLWKGAVHKWPTVAKQTTSINLAGYKDKIRKYLLGRTGLPTGIFVIVAACEDKGSRGMVYAPARFRGKRHRMFSILVRGIWFDVIVDKNAGAEWKALCCVQSDKKVLHLTDCHRRFMHAAGHIRKTAKVAPSLAR